MKKFSKRHEHLLNGIDVDEAAQNCGDDNAVADSGRAGFEELSAEMKDKRVIR